MNIVAALFATGSIVALGAFWPALKVHFDAAFARKFLIPTLAIATINCFVLSGEVGWWTLLAYPLAYIIGSGFIGSLAQGKRLGTIIFDGGIWLIGATSIVLMVVAALLAR
jgi:Ca2+/Na+ antiporter